MSLYLVSLLGQWPYRCEECGTNFLLRKRYLRPKYERPVELDSSPQSSRVMLTAPVGGVAGSDDVNARHGATVRDLSTLGS